MTISRGDVERTCGNPFLVAAQVTTKAGGSSSNRRSADWRSPQDLDQSTDTGRLKFAASPGEPTIEVQPPSEPARQSSERASLPLSRGIAAEQQHKGIARRAVQCRPPRSTRGDSRQPCPPSHGLIATAIPDTGHQRTPKSLALRQPLGAHDAGMGGSRLTKRRAVQTVSRPP